MALQGHVTAPTAPAPSARAPDAAAFFWEVDYQHATETYQQLLAAPALSVDVAKLRGVLARLRSP